MVIFDEQRAFVYRDVSHTCKLSSILQEHPCFTRCILHLHYSGCPSGSTGNVTLRIVIRGNFSGNIRSRCVGFQVLTQYRRLNLTFQHARWTHRICRRARKFTFFRWLLVYQSTRTIVEQHFNLCVLLPENQYHLKKDDLRSHWDIRLLQSCRYVSI